MSTAKTPRWANFFQACAEKYHGEDHQGWLEEEKVPIFFFLVKETDRRYFPELGKTQMVSVYRKEDGSLVSQTHEEIHA